MSDRDYTNEIEFEYGGANHAEVLHKIFNSIRMKKYSPVAEITVSKLKQRLAEASRNFGEKADFFDYLQNSTIVI